MLATRRSNNANILEVNLHDHLELSFKNLMD